MGEGSDVAGILPTSSLQLSQREEEGLIRERGLRDNSEAGMIDDEIHDNMVMNC